MRKRMSRLQREIGRMNAKESEQISEDESAIAFENLKNVCL